MKRPVFGLVIILVLGALAGLVRSFAPEPRKQLSRPGAGTALKSSVARARSPGEPEQAGETSDVDDGGAAGRPRIAEAVPEEEPGAALREAAASRSAGAAALGAPSLVDRPPHEDDGTPREVLTRRSIAVVIELSNRGASLRKQVTKELPYRRNNRRARGRYAFQVQDGEGRELFTGGFDAPELCPLGGVDHQSPHRQGHVILEHASSVLLRVPRYPAGARLVIYRNVPGIDPEPSRLASLTLD